jgi:hypothetical protein
MKYFFGAISKNQVDSIINYSLEHPTTEITFIPSRRQIEYNGGYVNNWTTKEFTEYVKKSNSNIKIERDHSGPDQGIYDDDGYDSLREDCKYFDIIHIDPWKKYPDLNDGINWTIDMIRFCNNINPDMLYEIGTEEAIRPYSLEELDTIISTIKNALAPFIYEKIKYCVVQCGNSLCNGKNSGIFNEDKLTNMINLVNKYNLISKEHNGDWVSMETIQKKRSLGLECINIAPEFGMIETKVILDSIKQNKEHYDKIYDLCYQSEKWKKWVSSGFDFKNKKDELILITGHYIFSNSEFQTIKQFYKNIDIEIKRAFTNKLLLLNFIYETRDKCIFCQSNNLASLFDHDYMSSLSLGMYNDNNKENYFMPYNVLICNECNSAQNKYIGDLSIIYNTNHVDNYGSTKNKKHELFSNFISKNKNINGIIEVGSCNGVLANEILNNMNTNYNIIEPAFVGDNHNINIIEDYFENVDLTNINSNTIIMSDVFEHFYKPIDVLNKLVNSENITYIYLSHPDFDYSVKNIVFTNLNSEHTFLIEHQFLFKLFESFGFFLTNRYDYNNYSLFLEFKRNPKTMPLDIKNKQTTVNKISDSNENICKINGLHLSNEYLKENIIIYFNRVFNIVKKMNDFINNNVHKHIYIWPTSVHSSTLFTLGLNYKKLSGILDNSPNKIGKYTYGYNLLCSSLDELLRNGKEDDCVFISGAGNYIKELDLTNTKIKIIFINEL